MKHIFRYEWKLFLRNRTMLWAWVLMLGIGLYAIYYGWSFNDTQSQLITKIDTAYQVRVQKQLRHFSADTTTKEGKSAYANAHDPYMNEWYVRPVVWKRPDGLQALTLGQSDNQPFYYDLWVYNNVYNTRQIELRNPDKLLAGNFDLAFVIIYLLPLFIIACSYNIVSTDRENGITGLLAVQGIYKRNLAAGRLLFRCCLVLALALLLSITGMIINGVAAVPAVAWTGITIGYILFWFAWVYLFVGLNQSGAVTALKLVSVWIILLILVPSVLNSLQKNNEDARLEVADASREYGSRIWYMDKQLLTDTLFQVKPDWKESFARKLDTNELKSVAYTYFTMQNMNNVGRRIDSIALQQQSLIEKQNVINPVFAAQLLYNKLSGTELNNYIEFRKAASGYQEQRYDIIGSKQLAGEPLTEAAFMSYPAFTPPAAGFSVKEWLAGMIPLLCFTLLCLLLGNYYWKISHHIK